jgi:hypothetical protein
MRFLNLSITVALAGLISACGGGGGSATAPAPTATAAISSSNQTTVAQDTASASFTPITGAQTLTGVQTTDESVLFSIMREQLDQLPTYMANAKANSALAGAVTSINVPCTSGNLVVAVTDADNSNTVSVGDSLTITSNSCTFASGNAVSGSLGFTVSSLSGTWPSNNFNLGVTVAYNSFTVTAPGGFSASANGNVTLTASSTGANTLTDTVSTSSLTVTGTYGLVTRTRTLTNYSAVAARSPDATYTYVTTFTVSGAVNSTGFSSQTILFNTTTPFVKRNGVDNYPYTGVMLITGTNNSKLRVTAQSNTTVLEELDANGDGTYESSATVLWTTLI